MPSQLEIPPTNLQHTVSPKSYSLTLILHPSVPIWGLSVNIKFKNLVELIKSIRLIWQLSHWLPTCEFWLVEGCVAHQASGEPLKEAESEGLLLHHVVSLISLYGLCWILVCWFGSMAKWKKKSNLCSL